MLLSRSNRTKKFSNGILIQNYALDIEIWRDIKYSQRGDHCINGNAHTAAPTKELILILLSAKFLPCSVILASSRKFLLSRDWRVKIVPLLWQKNSPLVTLLWTVYLRMMHLRFPIKHGSYAWIILMVSVLCGCGCFFRLLLCCNRLPLLARPCGSFSESSCEGFGWDVKSYGTLSAHLRTWWCAATFPEKSWS